MRHDIDDALFSQAASQPRDARARELHELAEGLQAASNYLETLRQHTVKANGGRPAAEVVVIDKIARQLDRAQDGFRRLRDRLATD